MKNSLVCISVLFMLLTASASEQVDFSGEWVFDRGQSEYGPGGDRFVPITLKIIQNDTLITVVRTYQREHENDFVDTLSFTFDGADNHSNFLNSPRIITAHWSNDNKSLIINTKIIVSRDGQNDELFLRDIWTLVENGVLLSRNFTIDGPLGRMKAHYIFTRMDEMSIDSSNDRHLDR